MNIEESIQQIETLIEAWQLDEADLNQTDINAMQTLLKENEELKEQNKKEFADYIKFKKEQHDEYLEKVNKLIKEKQELKKQLENNSKINVADHKYASTCEDKVIVLETQQKEFIKYLEDEIKKHKESDIYQPLQRMALATLEHILQKYKEITGGKDENN